MSIGQIVYNSVCTTEYQYNNKYNRFFKLNQDLVFNVVIPYDFTELIWLEVHTEMFT